MAGKPGKGKYGRKNLSQAPVGQGDTPGNFFQPLQDGLKKASRSGGLGMG
jgi:hypothetical protein